MVARRVVMVALLSMTAVTAVPDRVVVAEVPASLHEHGRPVDGGSNDQASGAPTPTGPPSVVEPALRRRLETTINSSVTVEVVTTGGSAAAAATAVGGTVVRELAGLALVTVPAAKIDRLATHAGVTQVRLPTDLRAARTEARRPRTEVGGAQSKWSEFARDLNGPGDGGFGQKIGIIGLFDATVLTQQIAGGDLPQIPSNNRTCIAGGVTCPFGTPGADYGNAIAEAIADAAPMADLYLAELGGGTDYLKVVDWMAARGVTTLLGYWTTPYDGPGNGTGFSASLIDYAVSKGILWVNAAGELGTDPLYQRFGGPHWRGTWADGDNDRWLNFSGVDETITAYCGYLMGLRWNDWGAAKTDYDLYVSDYRANDDTNGTRVLASGANQGTGVAAPLEGADFRNLCNHDPARGAVYDTNGDNFVSLWVYRTTRGTQTPVGDILEITAENGFLEYSNNLATTAVSFADTRSPGALVIGAVSDGGSPPYWASSGPTNDGRIKPDFTAETCIRTSLGAFDFFPGGNCSDGLEGSAGPAGTIAGFAAVLAGRQRIVTPADRTLHLIDMTRNFNGIRTRELGWWPFLAPPPIQPASSETLPGKLRLLPAPVRVLETRPPGLIGTTTPGPITPQASIRLKFNANHYVQEGDVALLNVTMVKPPSLGWLQVYPPYISYVGAGSNLNIPSVGNTVANLVAVRVDANRSVSVWSRGTGHMVVDLLGYFTPQSLPLDGQGRYVGLDPYQVANTVGCVGIPVGCTGAPIATNGSVQIPLANTSAPGSPANGIPATGNYAAVVSITATPSATGYASALPGGTTGIPPTSTLNFLAGYPVTNMAIVPISNTNGSMRLFTSATSHFRVDVLGYFRLPASDDDPAGRFVAPAPKRLFDTRNNGGARLGAGNTVGFSLGDAGRWSGTEDVWLNVTAVDSLGAGRLQVSPTAATPMGNHVNVSISGANRTVASAAITRVDDRSGVVRTSVTSHVIADFVGYFTPSEPPMQPGQIKLVTRADGSTVGPNVTLAGVSNDENTMLVKGAADSPSAVPGSLLSVWDRTDDDITSVDVRDDSSVFAVTTCALTGDGATVLLASVADSITPGDTDAASDVFARTVAGSLEVLSVSSSEVPTAVGVGLLHSSDDGRFVLMQSAEEIGGWGAGTHFVRDRALGTTISLQSLLPSGSRGSIVQARVSGDGSRVVALLGEADTGFRYMANGVFYRVAFISLNGGASTVMPYTVSREQWGFDVPQLSDITPNGSHVMIDEWIVGADRTFAKVPGDFYRWSNLMSDDRKVVLRTSDYQVLDDATGPQHFLRSELGQMSSDLPQFIHLTGDGSAVYFASDNMLVAPQPTFGRRIYYYDVTP